MSNLFAEIERGLERMSTRRADVERLLEKMEHDLATAEDIRERAPDWALKIAYQAVLDACTALMAAHGYRARVNGHHYMTIRFSSSHCPSTRHCWIVQNCFDADGMRSHTAAATSFLGRGGRCAGARAPARADPESGGPCRVGSPVPRHENGMPGRPTRTTIGTEAARP